MKGAGTSEKATLPEMEMIQGFDHADTSSFPFEEDSAEYRLLEYWLSKKSNDHFPARSDVDLCDLFKILPSVFLVERISGSTPDFVFRFVGTGITTIEGEITGSTLSSLIPRNDNFERVWKHYLDACDGRLGVRQETLNWQDRDFITYQVMLLPLLDEGGSPAVLIGVAHGKPVTERSASAVANSPGTLRFPGLQFDVPEVVLGADGIVTIDYTSKALTTTPDTIRFTRQKVLELGARKPLPIIVKSESLSGFDGDAQEVTSEREHLRAVKAVAIVNATKFAKIITEEYLSKLPPALPSKRFDNENEAIEWLKSLD